MLTNRVKIALGVLVIVIIILVLYINKYNNLHNQSIEAFTTQKSAWNRNACSYSIGSTFEDVFKKYNITKSQDGWNLYLPCNYDNPNKEIDEMPVSKDGKYFIVSNPDSIVAKDWLWKNVVEYYGMDKARVMLPYSYLLNSDEDLERFDREYEYGKLYIMKKNIQRQEGLKITNNREEILDGAKHGYVIVQELLQNPYLISGRKTNMRFYVLVICKNSKVNVYVYNNGFMYYTKGAFVKNSVETDPNITTGYVDRQVYVENPLTHDDLKKYLDKNRKLLPAEQSIRDRGLQISKVYFQRIYDTIRDVYTAFVGKICTANKLSNNVTFQLFGVDIAVDDELKVKMIEVNKGCDMTPKCPRDKAVKQGVVQDIFKLVEVIANDGQNGFIKII